MSRVTLSGRRRDNQGGADKNTRTREERRAIGRGQNSRELRERENKKKDKAASSFSLTLEKIMSTGEMPAAGGN
ncbi:hypothetical protein AtNW77_Chr3g0196281 [Arabidopsis thaliana]|uniref:Uncharacterized protein n=3 Tax=Arabidopsis TaxID=3701 RepID=Q1G3A0_ARATH|nr:uncharacterized protein AT3G43432 [Arabidopsis thaliana]ABF59269.1 unknown protein [Arabidopsis thaliana]AEE77794.1 hypothetical protein AT3G43432 [Arabidopsis thaliana]KAG7627246.1 hypothetical protein ISN45_At03g035670 [Arabidopsis thaliana x Arabidopsis arenosa]|eukprot:NP_001118761.1 hypothetical protein AT3G43432 [Arabidopsis thaliana]